MILTCGDIEKSCEENISYVHDTLDKKAAMSRCYVCYNTVSISFFDRRIDFFNDAIFCLIN